MSRASVVVEEYQNVYFNEYKFGRKSAKPYLGFFTLNKVKHDCGAYLTAKEAALAVDKKLISLGEEPRNILKKV